MRTLALRQAALSCIACAALVSCADRPAAAGSRDVEADLQSLTRLIRGAVVYQRPDGIYKTVLGEKTPVRLAKDGTYPRWSPDGQYVAFVRGRNIMRVTTDGTQEEVLAKARAPRAVAYHPNGREVLFTDGRAVRSVELKTRRVRTVVEGYTFCEVDISADGRQLVATIHRWGFGILGFDLHAGKRWRIAGGCSASLSPDGRLVTNNGGNHAEMYLRSWKNGKRVRTLKAPPGHTFDNQRWSNRPDWLVSKTEGPGKEYVFVHQISTERSFQVTRTGDCDRPDLYVSEELEPEKGS